MMKVTRLAVLLISLLFVVACASQSTRQGASSGRTAAQYNVQLGVEYMRAGEKAVALEKLKKALHQDPTFPDAHNAIAVLYESLGEIELADRHFGKSLSLDKKNPSAHNNYGGFLCRNKRFAEAERQFMAAAKNPLYATPELAYLNAAMCARRAADFAKTEQFLRAGLELNPLYAPGLLQMAKLSVEQENHLRARAYLQRYQDVAQHTAESLWVGIQAERALKDLDTASSYELLLRSNFPDSPQARAAGSGGADE